MSNQELRAEYCPACRKYHGKWKEFQGMMDGGDYLGLLKRNQLLQDMHYEARELPASVTKRVESSGICEVCGPTIYSMKRLEDDMDAGIVLNNFFIEKMRAGMNGEMESLLKDLGKARKRKGDYDSARVFVRSGKPLIARR